MYKVLNERDELSTQWGLGTANKQTPSRLKTRYQHRNRRLPYAGSKDINKEIRGCPTRAANMKLQYYIIVYVVT